MAYSQIMTALVFAVTIARISPSACHTVEGKVSCTDCTPNYDFSGIKVSVKCEGVKNLAVATTEDDGFFKVELPSEHKRMKCFAKLAGGPNQLYASNKNQVSKIVKRKVEDTYTISTPLSFFTSSPPNTDSNNMFYSSKTFDIPLPREWGLAPSSFYLPFFPIIGIP